MTMMVRNGFLMRLHRRLNQKDLEEGVKEKIIKRVFKDMEEANIFNEVEIDDMEDIDEWDQIEKVTDIIFSDAPKKEKLAAIKKSNVKNQLRTPENRIINKCQEVLQHLKEPRSKNLSDFLNNKKKFYYDEGRFGRSPLHEAVVMEDIKTIKKFVKEKKYLQHVDNNNHTPLQMAKYRDYKDGIKILEETERK